VEEVEKDLPFAAACTIRKEEPDVQHLVPAGHHGLIKCLGLPCVGAPDEHECLGVWELDFDDGGIRRLFVEA